MNLRAGGAILLQILFFAHLMFYSNIGFGGTKDIHLFFLASGGPDWEGYGPPLKKGNEYATPPRWDVGSYVDVMEKVFKDKN